MAEQERKPSKPSQPLEIESLTPDDLSVENLEEASGGIEETGEFSVCQDYVSCKGYA